VADLEEKNKRRALDLFQFALLVYVVTKRLEH
jgi:hypothetical protein